MTSPGKRQREALDIPDGIVVEDGLSVAPPAKSPNLGVEGTSNGPRQTQNTKLNRFGFGSGIPKPNKSTNVASTSVDIVLSNQDENDPRNENKSLNGQRQTKPIATLELNLDERVNKGAAKPLSNPKTHSIGKPRSIGKPASAPKPVKRGSVLPQPRVVVKPRSVRRTTIPPPTGNLKENTEKSPREEIIVESAVPESHFLVQDSFVALIKERMGVISQIDEAVKPKRSKLKQHDWKGKYEEQKATLVDLRGLLRRVVDEAKLLEQDAFKLDQTLSLDRKVLQREVDQSRERNQQVDAVTQEIQSNFNDMQLRCRMLLSDKERLSQELSDYRAQMSEASDLQAQLTENQSAMDRMKLEYEKQLASLVADNKAMITRLESVTEDHASVKASLAKKDNEVSTMFTSLRQMQEFATGANVKLEAENGILREKLSTIEAHSKDLETKYTEASTSLRHVEADLQACRSAKDEALTQIQEKTEQLNRVTIDVHEHIRQASIEKELRVLIDSQMRELRVEQLATNAQMEAVKAEMKHMQERHADKSRDATKALEELQNTIQAMQSKHSKELDQLKETNVSLESELQTWRMKEKDQAMVEMTALVEAKREADVLKMRLKELSLHGMHSMEERNKAIEELQAKLKEGEVMRRKMHNTIQELRGNVRVFARTRPFLPSDGENFNSALACDGDLQRVVLKREKEAHAFTFDRVFSPVIGQDAVFEEVAEFVQSAIDGYQVCLFSYGQTGSGKTHTMQGSGNGQMRGIIPRSIEKIITECDKNQAQGWKYVMHASFLEIYNETVRDLLADKADLDKKLTLKMDPKGGVTVADLTLVQINSLNQVEGLMEKAARVRSVACTDMNAQSSRSHSVFSLHLRGVNDSQGNVLEGRLNLVDLAGSERLSKSGATGSRLKETQAINKSLSCLTDVFAAIGNKSPHIPFRNSKLTYLLQSCLSGDGKTLMMVNLSPTVESAHESLCSLRFAQHVNQCELGKPKRQLKKKSDDESDK